MRPLLSHCALCLLVTGAAGWERLTGVVTARYGLLRGGPVSFLRPHELFLQLVPPEAELVQDLLVVV